MSAIVWFRVAQWCGFGLHNWDNHRRIWGGGACPGQFFRFHIHFTKKCPRWRSTPPNGLMPRMGNPGSGTADQGFEDVIVDAFAIF